RGEKDVAPAIFNPLVIAEDECSILADWTPQGEAVKVISARRFCLRKYVSRRQPADAVKLERASVQLIRAGTKRDIRDCASGAPQLCLVVAGADIHCLDGLDRRNKNGQLAGSKVVVNTFQLYAVRKIRLAINARGEAVLRVIKLRVRAERATCARNKIQQT